LRGEIPEWTGPILPPLYKNTRAGRIEEYRNRPIVPCAVDSNDPVIPALTPEQREVIHHRYLKRIASYDPPPQRYFSTPAEIAEFNWLRQIPDGDYRIPTGQLFNGPKQQQQFNQEVKAVVGEEEEAFGGEQEGAVGGGETKTRRPFKCCGRILLLQNQHRFQSH
jgi:hypothetical protein